MVNIKNKLNFGISFGLLLLIILGGIIWADSNGVWYNAQDVRGGIFGSDEQPITNFTFMNNIFINDNLTVSGYISVLKSVNSSNQSVTKNDVDSITSGPLANAMACNKLGMLYNGSDCIYATGVDITPTSFSFTNVSGVEFNTYAYSNEITLAGFGTNLIFELKNNDTPSSIVKNGVDTGLNSVSVKVGDKIKIKLFSKGDFELVSSVDYIIGSASGSFSVKTKPDALVVSLTSSTNTFNLTQYLINNYGWDGVSVINVDVTIANGVSIGANVVCTVTWSPGGCMGLSNENGNAPSYGWSNNRATFLAARSEIPALDFCVLPTGSKVKLINNGRIIGSGGLGSNSMNWWGGGGDPGGAAIRTCGELEIVKAGEIWGGGGGGGAGSYAGTVGACSGSTGAGLLANFRAGCEGSQCVWPDYGTETSGGASKNCGSGRSISGAGGGPGQWGGNGNSGDGSGIGGPPGASIIGNEYVIWTDSTGDIRGPLYTYAQATADGRVDFFP